MLFLFEKIFRVWLKSKNPKSESSSLANNNPLPIMTSHAVHEAMVGTTTDLRKVKTALLSVFNKDGLEEFGLFLQAQGVTIGKS